MRRRLLMLEMLIVLSEGMVMVGVLSQNVVVGLLLEGHDLPESLFVFVLPIF